MSASSDDDGEIPFLDADPLAEHQGKTGSETPILGSSVDPDEQAIAIIVKKLEGKVSSRKSAQEVEDMAIELYNRSCRLALEDDKSLKQLAQLVEEDQETLQKRLLLAAEEDDFDEGGGAAALLRALSDN